MSISEKSGQHHLRHYRADDRAACLSLFDSNVPKYFASPKSRQHGRRALLGQGRVRSISYNINWM